MPDPRAFLALDLGAATASAALIARVRHRWRLVGSVAMPASVDVEAIINLLLERSQRADPQLARSLGYDGRGSGPLLPRLIARSAPPQRLVAVAASDRAAAPLEDAARRAGWRTSAVSPESMDPLAMTGAILDPAVDAVLLGAGEPPGPDERRALEDVAALVAAAAIRRPELTVLLAGAMSEQLSRFETADGERQGEILLGPAAAAGEPPGSALRELLDDVRAPRDDARRAIARSAGALADTLDRRVEVVDIGYNGGLRAVAAPGAGGSPATVDSALVADACLVPPNPGDAAVDRVVAWSTMPIDRHRLRDRLRELRYAPWSDAAGDGARLRLAAARAALATLVAATPEMSAGPPPDLVVASGGAWAVAPGPAIALAIADVIRRPASVAIAYDHARLLGPAGSIPDAGERRQLLRDVVDDLLSPLASVVIPGGIRAGRSAGRVTVHAEAGTSELDLMPGGLELIDLPPGERATAELQFRDTVRLGGRGRRFAVEVIGGLGGLLLDLRDVPLRLPDRPERRRELLEAWQDSLWTTRDR
ncbi:MAG: hypothetical protein ACJ765_05095 [Chloroflexota bacterium]